MTCLRCEDLTLGYETKKVVTNLKMEIPRGKIISIIGPNGSGKSTILRSFSKLLNPLSGQIYLESKNLSNIDNKILAKRVAMLLQKNTCPRDLKVKDLIYYGRLPHKKWYELRNSEDDEIVEFAIKKTGTSSMVDKSISQLSGGESQRVWLAMAIAQNPEIMLLDEPTTYLDIGYQLELLELVKSLNKDMETTIIMVLHDLNQAAKYSDMIYILKDGKIYDCGKPENVINKKMLLEVYNVEGKIFHDEEGKPIVIPLRRGEKIG